MTTIKAPKPDHRPPIIAETPDDRIAKERQREVELITLSREDWKRIPKP